MAGYPPLKLSASALRAPQGALFLYLKLDFKFQGIIFTHHGLILHYLNPQGVSIMKKQVAAIMFASFVSLVPSITFADSSVSESGLMKAIHDRLEQTNTKDNEKYNRVLELAGDKREELTAKKDALTKSYEAWHDLKSSKGSSASNDKAKFKELEQAANNYSQASKEFVALQNEILTKNGMSPSAVVPAESINRLSASAATTH